MAVLILNKSHGSVKRIYLHAGTHKTGSTSLQVCLNQSREVLGRQGICYPRAGQPVRSGNVACGHHELAWSLLGKRGILSDRCWRALQEEVAAWNGDRVVLSAEGFQGLETEQITRVLGYLQGHEFHVVLYLRNPLGYMISSYKQRVKMGTWADPLEAYARDFAARIDYGELVRRWIAEVGREHVHLRIFDKVKKTPGLVADFCDVIGADYEALRAFADQHVNVSPPDHQIEVMRRINRLAWWAGEARRRDGWPAKLRAAIRRPQRKNALLRRMLAIGLPDSLAKHPAKKVLRETVLERHEAFLERYIAPEDRDLLRF